jgi:hypothetical protein
MKSPKELQKELLASCKFRGHKMGNFGFTIKAGGQGQRGGYTCIKCGMRAQYDTNPAPNDIDIGGEAVALNCNMESIRIN